MGYSRSAPRCSVSPADGHASPHSKSARQARAVAECLWREALRGELAGHYRLRVGDWRIVFRVQGQDVIVVSVANRKDIYED